MSKISKILTEIAGDPHYTCYKPSSSDVIETYKDIQDNCKEFHTKTSNVLNKATKILKDNIDNKDLDAFKNSIKLDTDEKDKTMKNVDLISQLINQEINKPSHYSSKSGKDVIDWCEDFGIMENAYVFNIFKYLCRAGKKNNNSELQDALKARIYLDRYIERLER